MADFGFSETETVAIFSLLEEDYQISRYLHFTKLNGKEYDINGECVTHVAIDLGIEESL